ncbi:MAG TPA: hypothetical protein DEB06_11325 [Phycisphaerales bacterium]|nr:hypothetical protein [Phycisphaerales bacterium]
MSLIGLCVFGAVTGVSRGDGGPGETQRARLTAMGFAPGLEGLEAALRSDDLTARVMALRLAAATGEASVVESARGLLGAEDLRLRFEAASCMAALGDRAGVEVMESLAGVERPVLLENPPLHSVVVDAANELALRGDPGYAYQLALVMDAGSWADKVGVALVLRNFRAAEDTDVELAWLSAIDFIESAFNDPDENVHALAGRVLGALLESVRGQERIGFRTHQRLMGLSERDLPARAGVTRGFIRSLVEEFEGRVAPEPSLPPAPLDPDPRTLVSEAVQEHFQRMEAGDFSLFQQELDFHGRFFGMGREEWRAAMARDHRPLPEGITRRFVPLSHHTRQPRASRVELTAMVDVLNDATERWDRYRYEFDLVWFGYGWHFSRIDRTALPEAEQPNRDPERASPQGDGPCAEGGRIAEAFIDALAAGDADRTESLLSPDGVFMGTLDRAELIVQLERRWAASPASGVRITPTAYACREEDGMLMAEVETITRSISNPIRFRTLYQLIIEPGQGRDGRIRSIETKVERLP